MLGDAAEEPAAEASVAGGGAGGGGLDGGGLDDGGLNVSTGGSAAAGGVHVQGEFPLI